MRYKQPHNVKFPYLLFFYFILLQFSDKTNFPTYAFSSLLSRLLLLLCGFFIVKHETFLFFSSINKINFLFINIFCYYSLVYPTYRSKLQALFFGMKKLLFFISQLISHRFLHTPQFLL